MAVMRAWPLGTSRRLATSCAILALLSSAASAQDAVADFYRGKQVTIVVGYGPGGSASFYAQALSHQIGRYLPGNPSVVVQHVPGAGGLLAANTIYNNAPREIGRASCR